MSHAFSARAAITLTFLSYIYFLQIYPNFVSPNDLTRLLLTSAIVDYGTIRIDEPIKKFGDTQDKAEYGGSYYSDKAIGLSLLAIVPYAALKAGCGILHVQPGVPWILFYLRCACVTIPFLALAGLLFRFWREFSPEHSVAACAQFLFLFGTIAFTYSVQFVSNCLSGMFLFASFYLLYRCRKNETLPVRSMLLSGACAGFAVLLEYPAAPPALILCLYAIVASKGAKRLAFYSGFAVFIAIMLGYNMAIFGTPFDVTYHHMADITHDEELSGGVFGFSLPSIGILFRILFGSDRGLFFFCPVLLLAIPGFVFWFRMSEWKTEAAAFLGICCALILMISGMGNWHAGWSFGPRYLSPLLPFLMTAAFVCMNDPRFRSRSALRVLMLLVGVLSFFIVTTGTITFPYPAPEMKDPVVQLTIPLFLRGDYSRNIGNLLGMSGWGSAILFYTIVAMAFLAFLGVGSGARVKIGRILQSAAAIMLAAGLLIFRSLLIQEQPVDVYLRGTACYFLGDYPGALKDLRQAYASTTDENLRKLIVYRARQARSKSETQQPRAGHPGRP